jgi:hypothetical protein
MTDRTLLEGGERFTTTLTQPRALDLHDYG